MPPPICRLRTSRPTPTTALFRVSTRDPLETLTARGLHYALIFLRCLLAGQILLILCIKWQLGVLQGSADDIPGWFWSSGPGQLASWISQAVLSRYLVPISLLGLWIIVKRGYTEESLLVLRGLGIQTTSSASTYLSTATTRFIPTTSIQDILIHEAFKGFEVRFYLTIVVEGEEDVVVVFPNLLPGLPILEEVWRGARTCLYEPKT